MSVFNRLLNAKISEDRVNELKLALEKHDFREEEITDDIIMDLASILIGGWNIDDILSSAKEHGEEQSLRNVLFFNGKKQHELRISQEKSLLKGTVEEGTVQCRKCGSKRVETTRRQTRSADEGMSAFFRCTSCSAAWSG